MPKPNDRQLELINKLALEKMTEDDVYVFRSLMIDDQETSYISLIHPNLLRKFLKDSAKGVGLLMSHDNSRLPVGRTFNAEIVEEYDENLNAVCKSLYGEVYIDLGRKTESGMSTNDIAKGIAAGTVFDVSIGFNASEFKCSVCGNDIRDYRNCEHIPGREYEIEGEDGVFRNKKCQVVVGENGEGELLELSLVYAGACDRATIKSNFSKLGVTNTDNGSKLSVADDIKKIPLNSTVYQHFSKDSHVLLYRVDETDETEENTELKRSEDVVDYLEMLKAKFGLEIENEEEIETKLDEISTKLSSMNEELESKNEELESAKTDLASTVEELESVKTQLSEKDSEIEEVKTQLEAKDTEISELVIKNEELTEKAGIAEEYRSDLITSTLESGVRAQGNNFQTELFEKFLKTLSIDEIKNIKEGFDSQFKDKFNKVSKTSDRSLNKRETEPQSKDDFETEDEFRGYVAEKASIYARENNVDIKEATKIIFNKFRE